MEKIMNLVKDLALYFGFGLLFGSMVNRSFVGSPIAWWTPVLIWGFIPFGWKWASEKVETTGIISIIIKILITGFVSIVVGPITLIKDIVEAVISIKDGRA